MDHEAAGPAQEAGESGLLAHLHLVKKTPTLGWAGILADFDHRTFGRDAWPIAVWYNECENANTYISYVKDEPGISAMPEVVAIGGVSPGPEAEILTIAVAPEFRRHGVGSLLLDELIAVAREKGGEVIFLEVRSRDENARRFYEKHGFSNVGLRRGYYSDDDAVVMRYDIE